jgi:3-hydroxyisobutyrate dehydrogenase
MSEQLGFIGLGIMGQGMARNLLKAKFSVRVWNRTSSRMDALVAEGAVAGSSPADVAANSDIMITCVSDTPDVEAVILGENGVIGGVKSGSLVIDCSTISPQTTKEIAKTLADKGVAMLDAPVSGGSEGAAKGTLSIMIGGAATDVERAMPVFEAMGRTITHVGETGSGQMAKLVNQVLVAGNCLAMCEALILAEAGGLDLEKTYNALKDGAAGSWMFTHRAKQIIERDWRPGFMIDLQQKDLRLVLEAADQLGAPLPGSSLIYQFYRTLQRMGLGAEGNHGLIKALENLAGFKVGKQIRQA